MTIFLKNYCTATQPYFTETGLTLSVHQQPTVVESNGG